MKPPVRPDWIIPEWPAPPRIGAFITTRSGGVSTGAYASLNLGLRTADDPRAVAANRERVRALLPQDPRWLRQVHGTAVVDADVLSAHEPEADGAVARRPGTVCAVLVADCIPVLLADRGGSAVAVAHAGWRGLAAGIIERTVEHLGLPASALMAYLGPGIGPGAFEVGADVRDAFIRRDPQAAEAFAPHLPGKWLADLFLLARRRLALAGVPEVHGGGLCTHSEPARFFSYRRDRETGRMAAFIWRSE